MVIYVGQFEEAEKLARQAIELDPLAYLARINLARVLFAEGKLDEAEAAARKAAELQPTAAGNHRWQVFVAVQRGDGEAALREAELEPNEGYRRFELALAYYARGDAGGGRSSGRVIAKDRDFWRIRSLRFTLARRKRTRLSSGYKSPWIIMTPDCSAF